MLAFAPLPAAVGAAGRALTWFTTLLEPLAGDAATAAAIVVLTVVVRLLISPLTVAQVRGERRRAALAPEVRELQRRYADDPARLPGELFALYRANGASPVSGCLPLLLQAPVLLVMYRLFTTAEGGTGLLGERLAGVPLGHHLGDGLGGGALPLFGVLLAVLLALACWTSRRMRRAAATATVAGTPTEGPGAAVPGRLLPLLPYTTVLVAVVLPLAAVIYLVTTTAWSATEQAVLRRPRPTPESVDGR
ncbi:membrane protein insertase YidC [Micromonospora sp. C31]|uniref:membrane protein insertase YidC n=1 Tax=Micromonospora sp. C31 TaxID=2824876 RepID=UPI001B365D2A|nr:membrane protein insertase YidC [Micromonospora sp. C31]MBQ1071786.1 membrane protein insertase YidC [Micromonospora sp. C31]